MIHYGISASRGVRVTRCYLVLTQTRAIRQSEPTVVRTSQSLPRESQIMMRHLLALFALFAAVAPHALRAADAPDAARARARAPARARARARARANEAQHHRHALRRRRLRRVRLRRVRLPGGMRSGLRWCQGGVTLSLIRLVVFCLDRTRSRSLHYSHPRTVVGASLSAGRRTESPVHPAHSSRFVASPARQCVARSRLFDGVGQRNQAQARRRSSGSVC